MLLPTTTGLALHSHFVRSGSVVFLPARRASVDAYPPRERWVLMLLPTKTGLALHTHFVRSGSVML